MRAALLLLIAAGAALATPIHQSAQNGDNSGSPFASLAQAYGSNLASGNLLITVCTYYNTPTVVISVGDTLINNWVALPSVTQTDGTAFLAIEIFYAKYSKSGADTVTCAFNGAGAAFPGIQIFEITGYGPPDVNSTGTTTTGTAVSSGAATTNYNAELLFATNANETSPPDPTPGTGYAIILGGTIVGMASEYQVQTTKGSQTGTFTAVGSTPSVAALATFVAKSASPTGIF